MRFPHFFHRMSLLAFLVSFALSANLPAAAQSEAPKNLQVFPKDIERAELIAHMRDYAFALGVACTHCHGTEEQTGFNLKGVDFSLDLKPAKAKAREMIRMTEQINSKLLSQIPASNLNLKVSCFTCHSGLALPEKIEDRVLRHIESGGIEGALEDYRKARERYHGSAAYNFKEQPLVEVAAVLHKESKFKEAAAISELNLEFHPRSGQSKFRLAEAYFELGNKEAAQKIYTELLQRRPHDNRVKARLEELKTEAEPES